MPRGRPRKSHDVLLKSAELIGWALGGLEREIAQTRERLTALTAEATRLRQRLGRQGAKSAGAESEDQGAGRGRARNRRKMSPEARKRMSEMLRKRWAERKKKGLKAL